MAQITKDFQKLHLPYISFAIAAGGVAALSSGVETPLEMRGRPTLAAA